MVQVKRQTADFGIIFDFASIVNQARNNSKLFNKEIDKADFDNHDPTITSGK